jgi:DNA polymerase III alpha subunit
MDSASKWAQRNSDSAASFSFYWLALTRRYRLPQQFDGTSQFLAVLEAAAGWDEPKARNLRQTIIAQDLTALASMCEGFCNDAEARGFSSVDAAAIWKVVVARDDPFWKKSKTDGWIWKAHVASYAMLIYQAAYLNLHHKAAYDAAIREIPCASTRIS